MLRAYKNAFPVTNLQIDFSTQHVTSTLNVVFLTTGLKGMLEGKLFSALDMLFPFISAFLDRATGYGSQPVLTKMNTNTLILSTKYYTRNQKNRLRRKSYSLKEKITNLKKKATNLF